MPSFEEEQDEIIEEVESIDVDLVNNVTKQLKNLRKQLILALTILPATGMLQMYYKELLKRISVYGAPIQVFR